MLLATAGAYWYFSAPVEAAAPEVSVSRSRVSVSGYVIVDVIGSVRRPGVVRLAQGSRVIDAVQAVGGCTLKTTPSINMARVLVDGEQIVVGATGEASGQAASSDGHVGINSATAAQLEALPGIGPVLAAKIVEYRTAHGQFAQLRDLLDVPGIGDAKYAALADTVSLS